MNLALAAATSLLDSRALLAPRVPRLEVDPSAPRALSRKQLRAVERETDRLGSSRDRAIMELLLRTGLRIGELAQLDVSHVRLTQRTANWSCAMARAITVAWCRFHAPPGRRCERG